MLETVCTLLEADGRNEDEAINDDPPWGEVGRLIILTALLMAEDRILDSAAVSTDAKLFDDIVRTPFGTEADEETVKMDPEACVVSREMIVPVIVVA